MQISANAVFPTVLSHPAPSPRHRFTIRAEAGFLAACPGIGGPPVEVVPDLNRAVHFVDLDSALRRARLMTELGWDNLRIVEVLVPSPL